MANCKFKFGGVPRKITDCDRVATTTLKNANGETVQLCEQHAAFLVNLAKELEADHWLVLNRIPS